MRITSIGNRRVDYSRALLLREMHDRTSDNVRGRIPQLCVDAGFGDVRSTSRFQTIFGTLELIAAVTPAGRTAAAHPRLTIG
jgi:hypothetical protein